MKTELINQIQQANAAYAAGIPFMTDTDYDVLWQQLHNIDPENAVLYHTSNSQTLVGTVQHKYPVYGTNKAFNMVDLKPFLTRFGSRTLVIEPKYDGCAAVITLTSNGWQITLEGNGLSGTNITHLHPHIKVPFQLRHFQTVELIIPWAEWNPGFGKNPRNVVAGWLARKNSTPDIKMTAIPHNFGATTYTYDYDGNTDSLADLLLKLHTKWSGIFPIDGLMIKVQDEKARLIAGTSKTTNSWSIAWKPPIQTKTTTVVNIEWNVSRLGRVIPTILYEPIELCGTTNRRVTANNAQWVLDKKLRIGSQIIVGKAGEIIPKIVEVLND